MSDTNTKEALEGITAFDNIKHKGCRSRVNAKAIRHYWDHDLQRRNRWRGANGKAPPPDYELEVQPLQFVCNFCGAAPGWGCLVRHDRRRARELGRNFSPLHLVLHGYKVGDVAVHRNRWHAACVEAAKGLPPKRREWATL